MTGSPIYELTRGDTVECLHHGTAAVVDIYGNLLAWVGDPNAVTFLRSSAKPFQVLSFLENGGAAHFGLTPREIALMCASHSGTDEHVSVLLGIQKKTGVQEQELLCGIHPPLHKPTAETLLLRHEAPGANRHNCSGKHTGMLAYAHMLGLTDSPQTYIDFQHPVQERILQTVAEMFAVPVSQVALGIDGCSAPNFAFPLRNAAYGFARLCDPEQGGVSPSTRLVACKGIARAMMANPDMVAGPGRFDSRLMEVGQGKILCKGGAEGFMGVGLMPGYLYPGSPALGIALKVTDGDARNKIRAAFTLEVLRQSGGLQSGEMSALSDYGPAFPVTNWRKIKVGEARPIFHLSWA